MQPSDYNDTLSWYSENAEKYVLKSNKNTIIDEQQLDTFADLLKPAANVLDAGSGSGRDSNAFTKKGFNVVGVDIVPELIKKSKDAFPNIDFRVGDITELEFENDTFDGVWAHASVIHFDKLDDVISSINEFYRVLKTKGILHLLVRASVSGITFNKKTDTLAENIRSFCEFDEKSISKIVSDCGFTIDSIERYNESKLDINKRPENNIEWILLIASKQ